MVKYSCEQCGKGFSQKSHYDSHNRRKTPCENNVDKIKDLVDKAVEEKLKELNKKLIIVNEEVIVNTDTMQKTGLKRVTNDKFYTASFVVKKCIDLVKKHIDIQKNDDSHIFIISPPKDLEKFIAKKGSVTIDGVSLTVNEIENNQFSLNIISHTWQNTIFRNYRINDLVNLEIDVVARYINK